MAFPACPLRSQTMPPLTTQALVRVRDARGRVASSPHPFTIAPQPTGLKLAQDDCGTAGWWLSWDALSTAAHGYAVLLANPDAGGEFREIGRTTGPEAVEFPIPANVLEGIQRPVLTVATLLPGNTGYGKRAVGVVANYSVPVKISPADLPFAETFTTMPSRYFRVEAGEFIESTVVGKTYGSMPLGSNLLGLVARAGAERLEDTDYFDPTKNAKNIANLRMCDLDLSALPPTESVILHISGWLGVADTAPWGEWI